MDFNTVAEFEKRISEFFGSPYAVAVDCCTHGIELCLRYTKADKITVPKRTYLSIPFLAEKLGIELEWKDENWKDYYNITSDVIDAAVLWKPNSYVSGTFMNISFQFQKHLSLGRGGIILTDNAYAAMVLKKISYDGRLPDIPWRKQNIKMMGYHYYMTPETAQKGLDKLDEAISTEPRQWLVTDWPDLTEMDVFKHSIKDEKQITSLFEDIQIRYNSLEKEIENNTLYAKYLANQIDETNFKLGHQDYLANALDVIVRFLKKEINKDEFDKLIEGLNTIAK